MTRSPIFKRAANWFIDIGFSFFAGGIFLYVLSRLTLPIVNDISILASNKYTSSAVIFVLFVFLYYVLSETYLGKTPAKYITRTKVINQNAAHPSISQSIKRTLSRLIPLNEYSIFFNQNRTWHDKISKTEVVDDPYGSNERSYIRSILIILFGTVLVFMAWGFIDELRGDTKRVDTNSPSLQESTPKSTEQCVSIPLPGVILFDVIPGKQAAQHANEVAGTVNATNPQLVDGTIIDNGTSGKYSITVDEGNEEAALEIIKSNSKVLNARRAATYCPPSDQQLQVR